MYRFCQENGHKFTRSRPYQKTDNRFVERKNYFFQPVVKLVEKKRVDGVEAEYQRLNPAELLRQRERLQGLLLKEAAGQAADIRLSQT